MNSKHLAKSTLFSFLKKAETKEAIINSIGEDLQIQEHRPKKDLRFDPKLQLPIIDSPKRNNRPYSSDKSFCPICNGQLTTIVHLAPLNTQGYTFTQGNLFPIVFPLFYPKNNFSSSSHGIHLIQWCSNFHQPDIQNMSDEDNLVLFQEISFLETLFLQDFPKKPENPAEYSFLVIKNKGVLVGGSIEHGHLQLLYTPIEPLAIKQDREFFAQRGCSYIETISQKNRSDLFVLKEEFFEAHVSPFSKRPLQLLLFPTTKDKSYFSEFQNQELLSLARCLKKCLKALHFLMKQEKKEIAYNLAFHTGPIGTFYLEILPLTQPLGGFEQLGLYLCQSTPEQDAEKYRKVITRF